MVPLKTKSDRNKSAMKTYINRTNKKSWLRYATERQTSSKQEAQTESMYNEKRLTIFCLLLNFWPTSGEAKRAVSIISLVSKLCQSSQLRKVFFVMARFNNLRPTGSDPPKQPTDTHVT